jgi:hypothetical protein
MNAPNYTKKPWTHPVVWSAHLISRTRDYCPGVSVNVATCECGWACCTRIKGLANERALQEAELAHWREVIAEAEAVAA